METGLDLSQSDDANCSPIQKRSIFKCLEWIDFDELMQS